MKIERKADKVKTFCARASPPRGKDYLTYLFEDEWMTNVREKLTKNKKKAHG